MVLAAKEIANNPDMSILTIALEYGYATNFGITE